MTNNLEIIVRALILTKKKILVCYNQQKKYYYLPGGHLKYGETIKQALARELKEELNVKIKRVKYIGLIENFFHEKIYHHELNFLFYTEVDRIPQKSCESHFKLSKLAISSLTSQKLLPTKLKRIIVKWIKNNQWK